MATEILLVEDSPGDVRLTQEAFRETGMLVHLHVAVDGVEAMAFLRHEGVHVGAPRPDLILLDLNLPRMDGRQVLAQLKQEDESLRTIPVVILSTSEAELDILTSYQLQAKCYLGKPVELDEFESLVRSIRSFWITKVASAEIYDRHGRVLRKHPAVEAVVKSLSDRPRKVSETSMTREVLLVEDSPGDVRLTLEAFRDANKTIHLSVATDGVEAMAVLRHEGGYRDAPRPDLILLDLNLPRMDGREVLAQIKQDESLRTIPVVILTTSEAEADIVTSYQLQANCYLTKPVRFDEFESLVKSIHDFWLTRVKLPHQQ